MEKVQYDVLVIGASNAGGMAAATAAEKGAKVLVIDKSRNTNFLYRETIASIHSKVQKEAGVEIDKNELVNYLSTFAQGNVDERLLNTWADHSSETVDWIDENVLRPHGAYMQATVDAYYEKERNRAFSTGNEVTAEHGQYWHMDYGANQALMQKWNPWGLKTNVYNDSHRDDGSGILAALEIGAAKDEEPASIVFNRGAVPVGTNAKDFYETSLTPPDYPGYLWLAFYPMLKVNLEGECFFNESAPYQFQMNAAAKQPGYLSAMIWTEATRTDKSLEQYHTLGCSRLGFPGIFNGDQAREGVQQRLEEGLVQKADTIEELAQKLGLPVANLQASVARYNEMVASQKDTDFGKESYRLEPVDQAPYYGAIVGGRLLATLDGLRVNTKMQVLNEQGKVIEGLYAAGNCSGGFFLGAYPDHVPGLTASHALTFGRLAGQYAVE